MNEQQLRELIEQHGFEIANFSYRLDGEGRILRHRMVIRSTDRSGAGRLAHNLQKTPAILEFRIAPTGD
jgi:putative Mg2+ transporter-C (MgtC) family protein